MSERDSYQLPVSTTFDVPGYQVERTNGLCWGLVVRSVGAMRGLTGQLRGLKAGEIPQYNDVVETARQTAVERLVAHAQQLGANAVLGVRFDSAEIGEGLTEILAYGTAATVRAA